MNTLLSDAPTRPPVPSWLTEENSHLLPLTCPCCGWPIGSTAAGQLAVDLPSGRLVIATAYFRGQCVCGAAWETRQDARTGRLTLVPLRPRRSASASAGGASLPRR